VLCAADVAALVVMGCCSGLVAVHGSPAGALHASSDAGCCRRAGACCNIDRVSVCLLLVLWHGGIKHSGLLGYSAGQSMALMT
jgi:hypothetical protein